MERIVICPDVHGRDFYKPLLANKDDKIIFLGDYEDPYKYIDIHVLLERMAEIFQFAADNPDRVILLLGNHSMYYYFKQQGWSRYDRRNANQIESLYNDYRDLFKLAYYDENTNTMFSHAGISMGWMLNWGLYNSEYSGVHHEILLNELLDIKSFNALDQISHYRGGYDEFGSCLWADVNEHLGRTLPFNNQIFGHTQLKETGSYVKQNNWIMCDSRCLFTWDGKNFEKYLEN